jgi:hypothetical protein
MPFSNTFEGFSTIRKLSYIGYYEEMAGTQAIMRKISMEADHVCVHEQIDQNLRKAS